MTHCMTVSVWYAWDAAAMCDIRKRDCRWYASPGLNTPTSHLTFEKHSWVQMKNRFRKSMIAHLSNCSVNCSDFLENREKQIKKTHRRSNVSKWNSGGMNP